MSNGEAALSPEPPSVAPSSATPRRHRGLWSRLGIQSKLLAMLLGVSIVSILATGIISYRLASTALTDAAEAKLVAVGDARLKQIQATESSLRVNTILNSTGIATDAMRDFAAAYRELDRPVSAADRAAVEKYYADVFVPNLKTHVDGGVEPQAFYPRQNAGVYLQARYTAPYDDFDEAIANQDAGDGSTWSQAHARYHPFFKNVLEQNGFEDVMLLDPDGNSVYTAYKGADLGVNLFTGAYRDSALAGAVKQVLRTNSVNSFAVVDYEEYTPSYNAPTIFGVSPIGSDGRLAGVLVIQLPVDRLNQVMTGNESWQESGLGDTGEVFLVGPDRTMRSTSRLLLERPDEYRRLAVEAGTPAALAEEVVEEQNPILHQKVDSPSVDLALGGRTGTVTETDYLGRDVITAYFPFEQDGLTWAVLAQIDEEEALEPVTRLFRVLAAIALGAVLLVTVLSTLLARAFTQPVKRLLTGVREVAGGNLEARVVPRGDDEFADLGSAFNDMATSLSTKQELLDEQMAENDRMISTMMPATVARRYRGGEQNIVEEHQDVSVVYGTIDGLDDAGSGKTAAESLALLNEIVQLVDRAAEKHGLEKVRTLRSGFSASCGLVVPRVDHITRCLDFAREVEHDVVLLGSQHGTSLAIRAGIDTGPVVSGLVGSSAVYDMWGESVNLAFRVQSAAGPGSTSPRWSTTRCATSCHFEAADQIRPRRVPSRPGGSARRPSRERLDAVVADLVRRRRRHACRSSASPCRRCRPPSTADASSMARPVYVLRTFVLPPGRPRRAAGRHPRRDRVQQRHPVQGHRDRAGPAAAELRLSGLNTALFVNADRGSWRKKLPGIFIDIGRIVIIAVGLAVLFSWVWGADVGGLFTALGVTSIVIGLALQTAIGSIVSGLLLLFEQPFELGDWLEAGGVTGRVVEVNWRAVHIQTDAGLQIVPNATLAGASFTNLSRPTSTFTETLESTFAKEDAPATVMATLAAVADSCPRPARRGAADGDLPRGGDVRHLDDLRDVRRRGPTAATPSSCASGTPPGARTSPSTARTSGRTREPTT